MNTFGYVSNRNFVFCQNLFNFSSPKRCIFLSFAHCCFVLLGLCEDALQNFQKSGKWMTLLVSHTDVAFANLSGKVNVEEHPRAECIVICRFLRPLLILKANLAKPRIGRYDFHTIFLKFQNPP